MKKGLSLSAGGAWGYAHLGVIKVLEDAGYEPSIISGASAGSIVGSLYAKGYSPEDILEMSKDFNLLKLLSFDNPIDGISSMKNFKSILTKYLGNIKFKDLNKRLIIAATNLETGRVKLFNKGQ